MLILETDNQTKSNYIIEVDFSLPRYEVGEIVGIEAGGANRFEEKEIISIELERVRLKGELINTYKYIFSEGEFCMEDEISYKKRE